MQKINYGFYSSEFGDMCVAQTDKGLCWVGFMVEGYKGNGLVRMKKHFSNAEFIHDSKMAKRIGSKLIHAWKNDNFSSLPLDLQGTPFQKSVWSVLLNIPRGETVSYGDVANDLQNPLASRAVGSAVGQNPVSLIVPCHRVLQKSGGLGNYGWGVDLKRSILRAEGVPV